jgi:hypothetical protein
MFLAITGPRYRTSRNQAHPSGKAALLRGQPTEIVEHRHDVGELWAEFEAMFPGVVNGEAVEITDAEVVPGADPGADLTREIGPSTSGRARLRHKETPP